MGQVMRFSLRNFTNILTGVAERLLTLLLRHSTLMLWACICGTREYGHRCADMLAQEGMIPMAHAY